MNMRCDQALLGAVLSDPGQAHALDLVRSSDFGCPWHAQMFEAIQRLRASGAAPGPHQVRAELPDDPDIPGHVHDQAWLLTGLRRGCPHSGHAVAYAGLVRGVGVRLARVAEQGSFGNVLSLAGRARADLETARQRWDPLPTAVRREIPTPSLDPGDLAAIANQAAEIRNQMGRLHAGLRAGNQTGLAGWAAIATQQLADISAAQADHMQPAAGQARPAGPEAIGAGEQCLRDLAASPGVIAEIRSWLRPAHFATAEQAELYTAIRDLRAAGKAIDPVTTGHEAHRRGIQADLDNGFSACALVSAGQVHWHGSASWPPPPGRTYGPGRGIPAPSPASSCATATTGCGRSTATPSTCSRGGGDGGAPARTRSRPGQAARAVTSREVRPFAAQAASPPRPPAITSSDPAPGSSARAEPRARDELRTAGITVITPEDELATETQTHGPDVRGGERWDAGSGSDPSNLNSGAARLATSYSGEPNRDSRGGNATGCTSHAHRDAEPRTPKTCRRLAQREREAGADPAPVREHVTRLREADGTYQAIAAAAGLGVMTVHAVVNHDGRVTATTAAALLGVSSADLPRARLDAGGTRLRLRALQVMGHGSARVARAIGVREQAIRAIVRGDACTVTPVLRDAVARTYDAWWDKRPPERTRDERTAATAARRRAIRGNWCAGACLDDDELDIPGYQPTSGWRPACGTGVAGDITPPPRTTRRSWAYERRRPAHMRPPGADPKARP